MDHSPLSKEPKPFAERLVAQALFSSRWLLVPFYLGLGLSLIVLLIKFAQKTIALVFNGTFSDANEVITAILSLVDFSLIANLLLMVMLTGYENFVSRFELDELKYKPAWMGHVDFSDIKVKLLTSIIAISAIHVLEIFMNIDKISDRELAWSVGILMAFVVSGGLLIFMNRFWAARDH